MSKPTPTLKLLYQFWKELPELSRDEVKEAVKLHLYECIQNAPAAHVRKIENYKKQIIEVNKLIVCKL